MKSGGKRIGRKLSASRQIHSATAWIRAEPSAAAIDVRRSALNRPIPLRNVRSARSSPKHGKRSTRIRSRRTTHAPRPS
jgi:hypothetical protein